MVNQLENQTFARMLEENRETTMKHFDRVRKVAIDVRRWAEKYVERRKQMYDEQLTGMCAIAAAELARRLVKEGIDDVELAMWEDDGCEAHVFVICHGHIVDVTATQYGATTGQKFLPVEIVRLEHAMNVLTQWTPMKFFKTPADLRKDQLAEGWPKEQVALNRLVGA